MSKAKKIDRNPLGLLKDTTYQFTDEGLIDWRKMLDNKWLYPNPSKNLPTQDISKLKDTDLCILLGGIKELAQVRGFTNVSYDVTCPSSEYVVANCTITWIPNYETEGSEVVFSSVGDAGPHNTHGFGQSFLGPIAENRAFVRCVRNFLKINVVAQDEIAVNPTAPQRAQAETTTIDISDPKALLSKLMGEKNINFTQIKTKLEKEDYPNAEDCSSVSDIPNIKIFELLDRIQKIKI